MSQSQRTVRVKCVAGRVVALDGGRPLAHGEHGQAPNTDVTRDQIASGLLLELPGSAKTTTREG